MPNVVNAWLLSQSVALISFPPLRRGRLWVLQCAPMWLICDVFWDWCSCTPSRWHGSRGGRRTFTRCMVSASCRRYVLMPCWCLFPFVQCTEHRLYCGVVKLDGEIRGYEYGVTTTRESDWQFAMGGAKLQALAAGVVEAMGLLGGEQLLRRS